MTKTRDESEDALHADHSPYNENRTTGDSSRDDNQSGVSPNKDSQSAEIVSEKEYSAPSKPDKLGSGLAFESDDPAEQGASLDVKRDDMYSVEDPHGSNDVERRIASEHEGNLLVRNGTEEHGPSGTSGAEGNGTRVPEGTELINLFVRNVAKHVMEEQLVDLFSKYGKVDSAVVVRDPHSKECRGFGFVKMYTEEDARQAMAALQDFNFEGRKISVERAKRSTPHSRTPGAYMGIDRRIRDRYVGMKRHREYEIGRYPPYPQHYDMRGGGYRGRYHNPNRSRPDDRQWGYRVPYDNQPFDDRDRLRRRFNTEGPRYPAPRDYEKDQRYREREPPVPRESADDYI